MNQYPVVIAGGGTVGLATAVFLGHHGVPSLVVERRAEPSNHPRALGISPRTLEFFREAGIRDAVDAVAVRSTELWKANVRTVAEIDRRGHRPKPHFDRTESPEATRGHYPQDLLDSVLLPAARERGATVEFGVEVTGVEQDDDGASVALSDGRVIRTDYLVGADGARSAVRGLLGISTTGPGEIGDTTVNILFNADLVGHFGSMPVMTEISHPEAPGMLLAVGERRWVLHVVSPTGENFSKERCAALVRTAIGADVPVEIVNPLPWRANVRMADEFRAGRVFLVGDAARTISPLGAFGLNTGLADAHNLAWKLAMVLREQAGDRLLDSYHEERHAVAELVTQQALLRRENPAPHWDPAAVAERAAVGMWNAPVVLMGYRYDSSAVVDPITAVPSTEDVVASRDGAPGSLLPHRWLDGNTSTLDLPESRFAVLTGPAGEPWREAAQRVAAARGLEVRTARLDAEWASSVGIDDGGALLVRPDGFIAWRTDQNADDAVLDKVLAAVTGR
ncbi:2-polyprenyl-6-methoxyphenol hydroxylase [Saccharopolyspora antimicrobica]|uniref:2-polyprenyl-6-methoxyphenol hydroxylase n=1 Tax=Saccharopolyspora antimicrobica TaxID=455193 RepID=A0A1I5HMY4_9PSEU|nr:FAD-dependent monooxygenase [Saccharopolyspora antimicrobica]RKT82429.1 2-polyprenyl-6-methoxyphenol hydroxylase-like FAD-dependent oxidoreductase [Saccharopolyspora antimicrobica]SFO49672.1 2-polyprenyl-6-methoxyphenol hydroxylase [Saccharopolyspora antimicrobica]